MLKGHVYAGAEWLETPGNCLAASISRENTWVLLTPSGVAEIPVEGQLDESEGIQPSLPSLAPEHEQLSRRGSGFLQCCTSCWLILSQSSHLLLLLQHSAGSPVKSFNTLQCLPWSRLIYCVV